MDAKTQSDWNVLRSAFLQDGAHIIDIKGFESGLDHLQIHTQTDEQKESGVAMVYKIYASEEKIK